MARTVSRDELTSPSFGVPKRPPKNPGTRPKCAPPDLDLGTKDAVGRALMHGIARVEQCLRRRGGLSSGDVEDFALECACLTYRNIIDGTIALCDDPAKRESQIIGYMKTMAWRMVA